MWIDEAGIRAGQKWRNEIADGIQVNVLFNNSVASSVEDFYFIGLQCIPFYYDTSFSKF